MKIISSKTHAILDYATVIFLLASPSLFKMENSLSTFTYVLAGVHFLLTILTNFEFGLLKVIPFRIHGLIEIVVAVVLAAIAFWFNSNGSELGLYFYLLLAVVIVPVLFRASANIPGVSTVEGFAMVTTGGLIGFLTGPSVIGFISEKADLSKGLSLLIIMHLLAAYVAWRNPFITNKGNEIAASLPYDEQIY